MFEADKLSYHYPNGTRALQEVSFQIGKSDKVALLGANGAGKSTLLLQLTGIAKGDGAFRLEGETLGPQDLPRLRRAVGVVFQNPDDQLFCPTVAQDVAYGPRCQGVPEAEISRRVEEALQAVQMEAAADRFPQNLSGGEKKRVALATILVMEPEILVLDEPTSGLDARARRSLVEILKKLDTALVVATHDLSVAEEVTQRALVLSSGRLVFDGATEALLADEAFLFEHGLKA